MKVYLTSLFTLLSTTLFAQNEAAEAFLERAWEKELALQSGVVTILEMSYERDSLISQSEKKLTFFHEPGNTAHHCILEDGMDGVYFSNGEAYEYHYRGFRRQWAIPRWPDEFKMRVINSFDDLSLGFDPERRENRPYKNFLYEREKNGDTMIHWDPSTRTLSIKKVEFNHPQMGRYRVFDYTFNSDSLLSKATETTVNVFPEITLIDKIIRHYSYSQLDQIPFFHIRQRLKEYQNAPLLSVYRPEKMEIKHYPEPGMTFPDLHLMDGIGRTKNLSSLSGPKILIYPFVHLTDFSVFAFVDSMEDAHPEWNFMLISQISIDDLEEYQRKYPGIRSFYLASEVTGLNLNGWPVWFILNKDGVVLAENHGHQSERNKEFDEWIKEHLGGD